MPPPKYKNLSLKMPLYESLCDIAEAEGYPSLSALVHDTLEAFVWVKKNTVPKEWLRRRKP